MTRNHDIQIADLSGQLAVVTGASDGIGRVIAFASGPCRSRRGDARAQPEQRRKRPPRTCVLRLPARRSPPALLTFRRWIRWRSW